MLLFQRSSKWITHFVVVTYIALYLFKAHTVTNCNQLSFHYININYDSFRIDNTDHIFDVNKKQNDHDQVDLVCPQTAQVQQDLHRSNLTTQQQQQQQQSSNDSAQQNERYIIYNVSKDEYDTCRLTGNPRVVALCDQTSGRQRPPFTVTFRPFTPQPNGLEFQAGQDYYFISALPGNPNDPKRFSPCRDLNMRVIFKVCCKSSSAAAASLPAAASTTASGGSAQVSRPGGSLSAALLPPTHRPPASSSSSRRPSVMTIRPSLLNHHHQQTQPQPQRQPPDAAADLFLRTSAPALAGAPFAPQVPVTVLPIEVLQPSSSEQPTQSSAIKSAAGSGADQDNSEQNNILQDQQQPSSPTPRPSLAAFPHLVPGSSFGQQQQQFFGHHHHQQQQPARPPLTLFDPNLTPDKYRHRYPPTPLPEQLLTNPQRRPETAPQRVPQVSRGQLYQQSYLQPWNSQFEPTRNTRVADRDLWKEPTSGASRLVEAHQHLLLLLPLLGALCLQHLFTNFLLTPTNHPHLHRYRYRYR